MRAYYARNKQKILEEKRSYYLANKETISTKKNANYKQNRVKIIKHNLAYMNYRSKTDPEYRLSRRLRSRPNLAFRNNYIGGKAIKELGGSIVFLKQYLESLFKDGMTWDNYGPKGWHIDHIKPLGSFNLSDEFELKQACYSTNLRPLWWHENLRKSVDEF